MAEKEATVYIVDVGKSMGEKHQGRNVTDLEWAMQYVWDKITTTVGLERKTAQVGVIGLKTDGTDNELAEDETYENLSVFMPIKQILMSDIRQLRDKIRVSKTDDGDAVSALILAIHMISTHCKKLKWKRRIILVTNGLGAMDEDDIDQIVGKLKEDNIELFVLGVDFDDPDFGFKEEDKDPTKERNEAILKRLAEESDGMYGTLAQGIEELGTPRVKVVRPYRQFQGLLTLGDPENYDSAMCINVERFGKIMQAKPPSASSFAVRSDMAPGESSANSSATMQNGHADPMEVDDSGLATVRTMRAYQVEDGDAPGGKKDVEAEELAKGYEYGRTAVAISESDMNVVKLETRHGMDIVGFVPRDKYERFMTISRSSVTIAAKANNKAGMALSSLIHALYELDSYAVARLVEKDGKEPKMILLAPSIEPDFECLIDVELPFAEDIRQYRFPPLDRVLTVAGKNVYKHRNLPSDALQEAMSDYVDSMDLSTFGKDEEGNPTEYGNMEDTYTPIVHRIQQALRFRAVHPTDPIPPPPDILLKYMNPPDELVRQAQPALDSLIKTADVKKVPPKARGPKRGREVEKPLSGLDVEQLLGGERRVKISADNAIPEFKQLLATTEESGAIEDASTQMSKIIEDYIRHSTGDSGYARATEAIRVMRDELNDLEEPELFNAFMRRLKKELLSGGLGGERREMWWRVRANRLGLIAKRENARSSVSEQEAKEFLSAVQKDAS